MKIFGREPTLWIAVLSQVVLLGGTFGLGILSAEQAALWVVAINAIAAAINAWTTRPLNPAVFTYAIGAIVSVGVAYGLSLSNETIVAINALVVPILALLTREQVSPQETPVSKA